MSDGDDIKDSLRDLDKAIARLEMLNDRAAERHTEKLDALAEKVEAVAEKVDENTKKRDLGMNVTGGLLIGIITMSAAGSERAARLLKFLGWE